MGKIKVAVVGLGNLGRYAIDAIQKTGDLECAGVIRRKKSLGTMKDSLRGIKDYESFEALAADAGRPDVAVICSPSRVATAESEALMRKGVNTVDSFDIHSGIPDAVLSLQKVAEEVGRVAVISAGWDPGTDSAMRAYFEAMAPTGTTFTNFGKGRSMGHSVAARSVGGVKDAVAITVPLGGGSHSRIVYVVPEDGENPELIAARIGEDAYFSSDPLKVVTLSSLDELARVADNSHGVLMERTGGSGSVSNQQFRFDMRINNPALTSQIMISCARASMRMSKGAYTMIDIPPVYLLEGDRMTNIKRLV